MYSVQCRVNDKIKYRSNQSSVITKQSHILTWSNPNLYYAFSYFYMKCRFSYYLLICLSSQNGMKKIQCSEQGLWEYPPPLLHLLDSSTPPLHLLASSTPSKSCQNKKLRIQKNNLSFKTFFYRIDSETNWVCVTNSGFRIPFPLQSNVVCSKDSFPFTFRSLSLRN